MIERQEIAEYRIRQSTLFAHFFVEVGCKPAATQQLIEQIGGVIVGIVTPQAAMAENQCALRNIVLDNNNVAQGRRLAGRYRERFRALWQPAEGLVQKRC